MSDLIEHDGVVESVTKGIATVRITQRTACVGCHALGACPASESTVKIIEAVVPKHIHCVAGQSVKVVGSRRTGFLAVLLACVVPFCLIATTLALCTLFTSNDALSGSIALGTLLPYFFVLYLLRNKLKHKLTFYVQ